MGELAGNETFTIEKDFEDSGHWEVTLRLHWTAGDEEAISNDMIRMKVVKPGEEADQEATLRVGKVSTAIRVITGWNATVKGEPVQVTPANIRKLPEDVFNWIMAEWEEKSLPKKAQTPLLKSESS